MIHIVGRGRISQFLRFFFTHFTIFPNRYFVTILFSSTITLIKYIKHHHRASSPMVIGTTPINKILINLISKASNTFPILLSNNFNISLVRFMRILSSKLFSSSFFLTDLHSIHKKDSPSGTSLYLANLFKIKRIDSIRIGYQSGTHIMIEENNIPMRTQHTSYTPIDFLPGLSMAIRLLQKKSMGLYTLSDI
ncbi:dihydrodipicolinate reductase C-terminal domain-containing protein [Candidatus Vidania fulgoroideorum]